MKILDRLLVSMVLFVSYGTANAQSSPIGLTKEELTDWIGEPLIVVDQQEKVQILEYFSHGEGVSLSENGLIGFGFRIEDGRVTQMLPRFRELSDAEKAFNKLKGESAASFLQQFEREFVRGEEELVEKVRNLAVLYRGIRVFRKEGEDTIPLKIEIIAALVEDGIVKPRRGEEAIAVSKLEEQLRSKMEEWNRESMRRSLLEREQNGEDGVEKKSNKALETDRLPMMNRKSGEIRPALSRPLLPLRSWQEPRQHLASHVFRAGSR